MFFGLCCLVASFPHALPSYPRPSPSDHILSRCSKPRLTRRTLQHQKIFSRCPAGTAVLHHRGQSLPNALQDRNPPSTPSPKTVDSLVRGRPGPLSARACFPSHPPMASLPFIAKRGAPPAKVAVAASSGIRNPPCVRGRKAPRHMSNPLPACDSISMRRDDPGEMRTCSRIWLRLHDHAP